MNDNNDFLEKIKVMNIEECLQYLSSAKITDLIISLIGISFCFLIIAFSNIILSICGLLFVILLANFSVRINLLIAKLNERIEYLAPK